MKISTKGRYALRLMLDLAVYNTEEKPISFNPFFTDGAPIMEA
jgi:DNA-binding IscR family transcriptional regulator